MQETWVRSLGQEALLEKKMATHSSILVGIIPWTEGPDGLQFIRSRRVGQDFVHAGMQPPSRSKKEEANHLKFRKHVSKSNKITFRRKSRIKTSESVALKVQKWVTRMKTEREIWCNGSRGPAASIGRGCRVHSESSFYSWLQTTRLSLIYLS